MIRNSSYRLAELLTIGPFRFAKKPLTKLKKLFFNFLLQKTNFFLIYTNILISKKSLLLDKKKSITFGLLSNKNLNMLFDVVHNNAQKALSFRLEINNSLVDFNDKNNVVKLEVDPVTEFLWPSNNIFQSMPLSNADIRYPYEFSRMHHLLWFAICWEKTGNEIWLDAINIHIEKVNRSNKFLHGVLWQDGLNISIRLINLVLVMDILGDQSKLLFKKLNDFFIKSFVALRFQLSSDSSITNNHSIGEFAGLAIASCMIGKNKLLKFSLKKLKKELERQYYSDHIAYEGSIPYMRFNLDFLMMVYIILGRKTKIDIEWLKADIKNKMETIFKISDNKAKLPLFGDGDDGRVIKLFDEPYNVIENSSWLAYKITGKQFIRQNIAKGIPLIFFNDEELCLVEKLEGIKYKKTKYFEGKSGFNYFARNHIELWVDCTPTGLGKFGPGGHGHNDTTSFILNWREKQIIIDSGWYSYYLNKETRDKLRGSKAHNVLTCNDKEQAILLSTFHISNHCQPDVPISKHVLGSFILKCGHNGFKRIDKSIIYKRIFIINKDGSKMRVIDKVLSKIKLNTDLYLNAKLKFIGRQNEWRLSRSCQIKIFGKIATKVSKSICSEKTGQLKNSYCLNINSNSQILSHNTYVNIIKTDFIFDEIKS